MTQPINMQQALDALKAINDLTAPYPNPYNTPDVLKEAWWTLQLFIEQSAALTPQVGDVQAADHLKIMVDMLEDSMKGLVHSKHGTFEKGISDIEVKPDGSVMLSDIRKTIARLRTAPPQPQAGGWLPIDKAPENGAWCPVTDGEVQNFMYVKKGKIPKDWNNSPYLILRPEDVTHFYKLPALPPAPQKS